MKLDQLFSVTTLMEYLTISKLVRRQSHPTLPLAILNYTEKAAHDGIWDEITTRTRGLIYNVDTLEIVARPFDKFFNYGEKHAPTLALDEPVFVSDKLDGSLGILYDTPDGPAIATRGSFASNQALHATELLRRKYPYTHAPDTWTMLFEIVYPANRIVVDYGDVDDLVLLGARSVESGYTISAETARASFDWRGPVATDFYDEDGYLLTFAEALALPPRPGKEGLVVCRGETRLKIKQEDYVLLHRIVTGLNERAVWQHIVDGKGYNELMDPLPQVFRDWADVVFRRIWAEVDDIQDAVEYEYNAIMHCGDCEPDTRKEFAMMALKSRYPALMFLMYDGATLTTAIMKMVRPSGAMTPYGVVLENADQS